MFRSLLLAAALAAPHLVSAQTSEEVRFSAGNFGTMVSGEVTGQEYDDYRLDAGAGKEMFVELTVTESDGSGTIYFNVLPPGSTGEAIYNSSIDGNSTTIALPDSGPYTIRVYQMGDDEDSGKTSAYNIDLSIQ